ncbi:hypothetical protein IWW34DRAFT_712465 [Fusarium oxysporum f. sp. albedinis]|uniref:Uncharacterized protein n=5 Tax=Fusarium oxysporum TaxID=5507 RepID=A0A2H3HII5_FUSOX|nr:uncharacterized protein FOBCDRAFT_214032 [Fusarium oxysporum Fo47]EWZ84562.1 hypothetical protein FOWG_12329 [Fusarium oxysporum f. sp. lycopersici MN25]EXL47339.1 hypothetical protein FOCG_11537 [Fusarium oxysporum f. sp. radicis-lycopersici 26381]KAF5265933.1 hypothetical protein FOXYS1_3235 [Fusarium oxysporum]KAH7487113.1 hypothetical protein FOMA001_g5529 [Fusarium oxysporum f. sp. matthiolae]KAI3587527.1 hypothetical protein IWW34DRAFT_712465 [Fusarium oxysporum f. sp. albedinis]PCD4
MKRYTKACSGHIRTSGLTINCQKRWVSYDKSELSKMALLNQIESELDRLASGKRARIHPEDKTVDTDAGRLPISPVMDYKFMQARRRTKKAMPTAISGQFRKKLSNNPYAEALIGPTRWCKNTNACLPRYFLQDFELVEHPDPEQTGHWWAPGPFSFLRVKPTREEREVEMESNDLKSIWRGIERARRQIGLVQNEIAKMATEASSSRADISAEAKTTPAQATPGDAGAEAEISTEVGVEDVETNEGLIERRARIVAYTLARKSLIDMIGGIEGNKSSKSYQARMGGHQGMANLPHGTGSKVFREDMGDVLLGMLRRVAVDTLITRSCREGLWAPHKFIRPVASWEEAKRIPGGGAILYIPKEDMEDMNSYATLDIEDASYASKMAVHDLRYLLGEGEVERLREKSEVFRDHEILVLKNFRSGSMRALHLLLWRLQGYLALPQVGPIEARQY